MEHSMGNTLVFDQSYVKTQNHSTLVQSNTKPEPEKDEISNSTEGFAYNYMEDKNVIA